MILKIGIETSNEFELKDIENYKYLKNYFSTILNSFLNSLLLIQSNNHKINKKLLIISGSFSFNCFYLSLLLNLNMWRLFKNNTVLIVIISGVISFILTFVYVCYCGYIFSNDIAYGMVNLNSLKKNHSIKNLFPNGIIYKWNNNKYTSIYEEDFGDY